ncbi:MAG: 4'-phosphopantetheinyl transferase superfamily protein [Bacteroidetes bacterium]|nr:4'-phosphopantetheinyl transferase superfamily protein [Bacteroidota bacterium]
MPLFFYEEQLDFHLAIWKMDEDVDELMRLASLSEGDIEKVNSFTHTARKKEWICIRMLLKKLNRGYSIGYHESGKPFLENADEHISISHTKEYAGLIISDSFPVGIDLERIHSRIEKIAHKFVSEEEAKFITGKNNLEKLFVIWGVKEVLFKMHSIGELIFKEHLIVSPFEFNVSGSLTASIMKGDFQKKYGLNYKLVEDLLITWCVDK